MEPKNDYSAYFKLVSSYYMTVHLIKKRGKGYFDSPINSTRRKRGWKFHENEFSLLVYVSSFGRTMTDHQACNSINTLCYHVGKLYVLVVRPSYHYLLQWRLATFTLLRDNNFMKIGIGADIVLNLYH